MLAWWKYTNSGARWDRQGNKWISEFLERCLLRRPNTHEHQTFYKQTFKLVQRNWKKTQKGPKLSRYKHPSHFLTRGPASTLACQCALEDFLCSEELFLTTLWVSLLNKGLYFLWQLVYNLTDWIYFLRWNRTDIQCYENKSHVVMH